MSDNTTPASEQPSAATAPPTGEPAVAAQEPTVPVPPPYSPPVQQYAAPVQEYPAQQQYPVQPHDPQQQYAQPYGQQPYGQPYAQQPYPAAYAGPPKGMSITALVLGLSGFFVSWFTLGIPSILAVVFGHLALKREPAGRGMALTGLITGYAAIGIFVIFLVLATMFAFLPFAFLIPALGVAATEGVAALGS
ncbi:uncharacterized protein DUF4190 [Diaminobutyricimonas aerilata]|uniref:Uncharacterized protein DUF4190 n=1 Tax=Diaminobutyricimonas aerilata TaxID=1162967 RepID=A0A2M9CMP1_9MICO|nr:DUF4190 domain-containing protein [Diaminobutyricimonas aerilata]PJJ73176.1 uncharacterized protein DUF4190 [Diaminobutyricimonas aerilata]